MKAKVFYVNLTNAQKDIINHPDSGGWSSELGREYMSARDGENPDSYLYQLAAEVEADHAETVWTGLQNVHTAWTEKPYNPNLTVLNIHTDFPRSMDVGDKIIWENGKIEICSSIGFKTLKEADHAH